MVDLPRRSLLAGIAALGAAALAATAPNSVKNPKLS